MQSLVGHDIILLMMDTSGTHLKGCQSRRLQQVLFGVKVVAVHAIHSLTPIGTLYRIMSAQTACHWIMGGNWNTWIKSHQLNDANSDPKLVMEPKFFVLRGSSANYTTLHYTTPKINIFKM